VIRRLPALLPAVLALAGPLLAAAAPARTPAPLSFDRDVRPILADNCFACHGFDAGKRAAGLRLDTAAGAVAPLPSGRRAIVPGKTDAGELLRRVANHTMPPPSTGKKLTPAQIAVLRRWIAGGARYEEHWALRPPRRAPLPPVRLREWVRNPVDAFILARLEREGLRPAPEADRATLIRRLSLDLTGLPSTPAEVDAFLADRAPDAYERVVDRLLASPRFGERMAWEWLDAARYADTNGYQGDRTRTSWPWRDWVIRAYNEDKPYDEFTIEQLAGDLLPNATLQQKIATAFNRNHMLNGEGGRIPEESRVDYVVDRVDTTTTVWMGLTFGCARCHDHKYDPYSQRDYYQLFAYFNNVPETGAVDRQGQANPVLLLPTPEQERALAESRAAVTAAEQQPQAPDRAAAQRELDAARKRLGDLQNSLLAVMVMEERPTARESHILLKGAYDRPGEAVKPGVPSALPPLPADAPPNRLALARWLVAPENPLTARVAVNRYWQMLFGTGLVKTAEDFGVQGERPSHPELLDWLALEFQAPTRPGVRAWSTKGLLRLLVTSAAYRQSSRVSAGLLERDPENRLLARGARHRLPSWMLRDQALAVGGLLVERLGGPSVKPYQPPGVWEEATFGQIQYVQDKGEALWRRSLYTFWRRIVGPTNLFDTAGRQACTVRLARTNTPLQALTLLNDVTYVEAARAFAQRVLKEAPPTAEARLEHAFRLVLARRPTAAERRVLTGSLQRMLSQYRGEPAAAQRLLSAGESPRDAALDPAEHAAWTGLCSLILNLDEAISRE
jgi:mono/diheme cytochrome c family protein